MNKERSMTDENADAWAMIATVHQIQRLTDWANMLEARVKELDPMYRAYPWGRKKSTNMIKENDMKDEGTCYVAADPTQPGAAWAATADEPRFAKDNAKEIASWIKDGAHVMRVPTQTARDMLRKWVRPDKNKQGKQEALL